MWYYENMIIKRELYLTELRPLYDNNLIKVLLGPRRTGKSEILKMIRDELLEKGTDAPHIIYVNFEDVSFEGLLNYHELNKYVLSKIKDDSKYYLMFDEIQHVASFEKALASLKATTNSSIFVTGSNSNLLQGSLASLLTGRYLEFRIRPFTYGEAVEFLQKEGKSIPSDFFEKDYLKWGGFPQRFDFAGDIAIRRSLSQLYDDTIKKDILETTRQDGKKSNIDKTKFGLIASYVLATAGEEFSPSSIQKYLKNEKDSDVPISANTIRTYLSLMERAFLVERVPRFAMKGKRILKMRPKIYALDNGMRIIQGDSENYLGTFFLENVIYNELVARGYEVTVGKKYNGEIDFVAGLGDRHCYIQVAYYLTQSKGPGEKKSAYEREYESFDSIRDGRPRYVISFDKIDSSHDGIIHLNVEDFLLKKVGLSVA